MSNDKSRLCYADERDKTYGRGGMAITLVVLDSEDCLGGIDLDAEPADSFVMSNLFGFRGNPRMSAKILWSESVKELRLLASVALGNVVCRRYILQHKGVERAELDELRQAIRCDADEQCALDNDEADRLFNSCLEHVDRLFRHPGIADIANSMAEFIGRRRSLSAMEAIEFLAQHGLR